MRRKEQSDGERHYMILKRSERGRHLPQGRSGLWRFETVNTGRVAAAAAALAVEKGNF